MSSETPLRGIVDTPLTEALIIGIFEQQSQDGAFPPTEKLASLFNVSFKPIFDELQTLGLQNDVAKDIHQFISTASILFYFLYLSQKAQFPVDHATILQIISKARSELGPLSNSEDKEMQSYIKKSETAVDFIIEKRDKYHGLCQKLNLPKSTWEGYIQHKMGLDK